MDPMTIGLLAFCCMVALIFLGVPIAFALGAVGAVGLIFLSGPEQAIAQLTMVAWHKSAEDFSLICIPFFILMGSLFSHGGIAAELYGALDKWMGRAPGGLCIATTWGCAFFGAITGSSVATVATFAEVAIPEMKKYGYKNTLVSGCLASAGTLGIIIPPSIPMIFYATLTEQSIGALFIAGVLPGILTALLMSLLILFMCYFNPSLGPKGPSSSWKEKFVSLKGVAPVVILFMLVLGSIYAGVTTPTEAGTVGSFLAVVICGLMGRLNGSMLLRSLMEAGKLTAMVLAVIICGIYFSRLLVVSGFSSFVIDSMVQLGWGRYQFLALLTLLYVGLGMVLDVYGMMILTVPLVFPVVISLGFNPVWFGIYITIMCEVALITPPVGVNLYVVQGAAPDIPWRDIMVGNVPFVLLELVIIALIAAFPQICLWLPSTMQ